MPPRVLDTLRNNWGKVYFFLALALVTFAYGFVVGNNEVFPHSILASARSTFMLLRERHRNEFPGLNPARYEGEGVVVNNPDLALEGVTLIGVPWQEAEDWMHSLRLVDMEGNLINKWTIAPETLWNESPHDDIMHGRKSSKLETHIHGSVLLPDGNVVFNLSHYGLVRLDACSRLVWKVPYRAHHSVFIDEGGNFWTPGEKWRDQPARDHPGLSVPYVEDTIVQVSPDGKIIREISVLDVIYRSGHEGLIFSSQMEEYTGDVTHGNDVEVLGADLAKDFPGLNAGDIMVSLRNISTVLIIDGETERVKWYLQHPIIRQHDPDFLPGGYVSIFDNRAKPKNGNGPDFGGSRIVRVRPFSNDVDVLYASGEKNHFYTRGGGKHQHLENGNILIGEPYAGRIFEVTPDGELVWSWLAARWAKGDVRVPESHDGTRYPPEFAEFPRDCS